MPSSHKPITVIKLLRPHRTRFSFFRTLFSAVMGVLVVAGGFPQHLLAASIQRGGGGSVATSQGGTTGGTTNPGTAPMAARAVNVLTRTSQAIQAVQAMQAAARNAAAALNNAGADPNHPGQQLPNVPNGLVTGGLVPDSGLAASGVASAVTTWQNAKTPTQTTGNGQTTVNIVQTGQQAILNWTTFNIGKDTTLNFDQSAGGANVGQWIAFNKVADPSGVPSQILGSMTAQGQVYVINQNGIIFGGASQVNVHSLVASSLPINDNLINLGLLNNPDDQFLFSALAIPSGANGTPAFTPSAPLTPSGHIGDVTVQAGAQIASPANSSNTGGLVALVGPNVTNAGTISTPDGQTILAAGLQVGFAAHDSTDPSLRGLDAYVGSVDPSYSGNATNSGLINSQYADVWMTGMNVNQLGAINSTTSVSLNGRIDLLADYNAVSNLSTNTIGNSVSNGGVLDLSPYLFLPTSVGTVTLGANSVTQILPDWSSSERVLGTSLALPSQINIQGSAIHLAGDATVFAPNGNVSLDAGIWNYVSGSYQFTDFVNSGGQVYLDSGAVVDVAGSTDVGASVSENFVSAQLLGSELANSPLQRSGVLRGQTIQIDVRQNGTYNGQAWVGTPLADVSGYAALVQSTAGELTTAGGTVKLTAGGSVVVQNGAMLDVSGGWIDYAGATVQTTQVFANGHAFNISQATPDRVYTGLTTGNVYQAGYIQGGSGGTLDIQAPSMALDGSFYGNTVAGANQRQKVPNTITVASGSVLPDPNAIPLGSILSLVFQEQDKTSSAPNFQMISPTPPTINFESGAGAAPADAFAVDSTGQYALRSDRASQVVLSPDLVGGDGFTTLTVNNSEGNINIPAGVSLTGQAGGSISLFGANIDIEGDMTVSGGSLSFNVYDISLAIRNKLAYSSSPSTPAVDPTRGHFTLGAEASLNTAGLVVDDRSSSSTANSMPVVTGGGAITIKSYSVDLVAGSNIDAAGGVYVSGAGKLSYGSGGNVTIAAGEDLNIASVIGGSLVLDASLESYSGSKGGTLSIQAPLIQIGDSTAPADPADTLLLTTDFFNQGGFGGFVLTGLGDPANQSIPAVYIAPDTQIVPMEENRVASLLGSSGVSWNLVTLPEGVRAPVSLSFIAAGIQDPYSGGLPLARGDFMMAQGAEIQVDPNGSVTIKGDTAAVLGSIVAPGGSISISGGNNSYALFLNSNEALPTVDLGPESVISAAGMLLLVPDTTGNNYRTGSVLAGGNITVSGNLVAEAGSVLNASGATGVLDLPHGYSTINASTSAGRLGSLIVPTRVDSNGGNVILKGGQELFVDATLEGAAGGPTASGGSLVVSSGRFYLNTTSTPTDVTMQVTQSGPTFETNYYPSGQTAIANAVRDSQGAIILGGVGHFAADSFNNSGFASLTLPGIVQFSGAVTLTAPASLKIGGGSNDGFIFGNAMVTLNAPYVSLGTSFAAPVAAVNAPTYDLSNGGSPFYVAPVYGAGSLTVNATSLIDLGTLSLQNIGSLTLNSIGGDIRGDGTLDVQGSIVMTAGQIYPVTDVSFDIFAYDKASAGITGSVTIAASGNRNLPPSAGGALNIYASNITQGGVLRAPIGTINLGWNGTGAAPVDLLAGNKISLGATKQVTLTADSITSVSAVDPTTGKALTIPYGTNSNGTSWIDPGGADITVGGVPGKSITIAGQSVTDQAGSKIDISGGGDLYAYRFVPGLQGSTDILASTSSFAVIPGYQADFAPVDPTGDYSNSRLNVGEQVYLGASSGLPAGVYTLLPAGYALLPGAFLITPKSSAPNGTVAQPDGATVVSGYVFNGLDGSRTGQPLLSSFEVASQTVLAARAEYDGFSANTFLKQNAQSAGVTVPRLPEDAGTLVFAATQAMSIQGALSSQALTGGLGGLVDISSPVDILIAGPAAVVPSGFSGLILDSGQLSAFGAQSLLIGGVRSTSSGGELITVTTNNITVDNSGSPLSGPDVILAANKTLTLAAGASVEQTGVASGLDDTLLIGSASTAGSGDGALLRVSSDASAQLIRSGYDSSSIPSITLGAGAQVSGISLTLDSTYATNLNSTAVLSAQVINLGSGQISLQLANPGALQPTVGLVLSNGALQILQAAATSLSLLSYTSIDLYGTGQIGAPSFAGLSFHTAEIRGFNNGGGTVTLDAKIITLDNSPSGTAPGPAVTAQGTLVFNAGTVNLGANKIALDQFSNVQINATGGILAENTGGLSTPGALTISTPVITGATGVSQTISAGGALALQTISGGAATVTGGLGASLTLIGTSVTDNTALVLNSGDLTLHATSGDVQIGNLVAATLDVSGISKSFYDVTQYTNGGLVNLTADAGNVNVAAGSTVKVSAPSAGGNAGSVTVSVPTGTFTMAGSLLGSAGAGGYGGTFSLDAKASPDGGNLYDLTALNSLLNNGGFSLSRSFRIRTGDVQLGGLATSRTFNLSTDQGSVTVAGTIDASGQTGGTINLYAYDSVTLEAGSYLNATGDYHDNAGKGGAISLEAGCGVNGGVNPAAMLDIQTGSTIALGVLNQLTTNDLAMGYLTDNRPDLFTGTLHLRAPQTSGNTDVQMAPINGTINNASSIVIEGYKIYDLTTSGGAITSSVETAVSSNATTFAGAAGQTTAGYTTMLNRLFANNTGLESAANIEAGAEIINRTGDLTLSSDWNLSTFRFGPNSAPGVLTLRAAGNLVFNASLSDGFTSGAYNAPLLTANSKLPMNNQSWSYRLTSGADFSAADFHSVQPLSSLASGGGSLLLGINDTLNISNSNGSSNSPGSNATTAPAIAGDYQVIRAGTGNIDISAGGNVELLNEFATIYTAGTKIDPTNGGTFAFDTPILNATLGTSSLGAVQESPAYPVQFSMAGGNVSIIAQANIEHLTQNSTGTLIADSSKELPNNWLYRRGYVNPVTGQFGTGQYNDIESTTWWVDFSNFFEGVGTLGGGNVTLVAGDNVTNVDAVAATNARMPKGTPNASAMIELGGGDVTVLAGNNIDAGVYYVERGTGTLHAGNQITTNSTRSPSLGAINNPASIDPSQSWLPTTLFLGKGSFDVSANGDLLLGPVANPFLLPEGYSNTFWYKTYFSTYSPADFVKVKSLAGSVTLREETTLPLATIATPLLEVWLQQMDLLLPNTPTMSYYQPWLRLDETNVNNFGSQVSILPPTLQVTAFSGDINQVGSLTLSPSPSGTVDLIAAGSVNGLQPNGVTSLNNVAFTAWDAGTINLSDANPDSIWGVSTPYAYQLLAGLVYTKAKVTLSYNFLSTIGSLFAETGATQGSATVLQNKQTLHAPGVLHLDDPTPIHLYSLAGDISGLTLYSAKAARVVAGEDITNIALYIQNVSAYDVSVVSAGRDIIAYDPTSPFLLQAQSVGNNLNTGVGALAGDIQISGPGTLEVFAGRNLDLGVGASNSNGTAAGITSIGNTRNPYLPFAGANVIAGAGIGNSFDLSNSKIDFTSFIAQFLNPTTGATESALYLPDLASLMGLTGETNQQIWDAFSQLPVEKQDSLALDVFYLVLRDAGRDHHDPTSPGFLNYNSGFNAIAALFPGNNWQGDISLTSKTITTKQGGDINIFAPGGQLTIGLPVANLSADQGILTENGGNISIFTHGNVNVGVSRIFTLLGGNEIIWSSAGSIAAGSSSKTVQSAPPTRVLIDPQSGNVETDLAGLATGGGIGVLETLAGAVASNVDLIAPTGTIDAGDAGIRVSGNLFISAQVVLNAGNIQAGGGVTGAPVSSGPAPSLAGLASASNAQSGASSAADQAARQGAGNNSSQDQLPSIISVEVLGYGGGDGSDDEDQKKKKHTQTEAPVNTASAGGQRAVDAGDHSLTVANF